MPFSRFAIAGLVFSALAAVAGCAGTAEDSAGDVGSTESDLKLSATKYLGTIASGETKTVDYTGSPTYRSLGFTATGGDEITVDVTSPDGDAVAWITDATYHTLAMNDDASPSTFDSEVTYKVPAGAPSHSYRIVLKEYESVAATFAVALTIKSAAPACNPATEKNRTYVGTPQQCMVIRYSCQPGQTPFSNTCGCGCETAQ